MSDLVVASTTDTQEQINAVAGIPPTEEPKPKDEAQNQVQEQEKSEVAEAATESASASEAEPIESEEPAEQQRKKGGFQKRIDKLTREKYELQDKVDDFRERLEALERGSKTTVKAAEEVVQEPKPNPEDFTKAGKSYEDYLEALVDWKAAQKIKAEVAKLREDESKQTEEQRLQETYATYNSRTVEFRKTHEDFDEVVGRDDLKIPQGVQLLAVELENGPELAYHLGQHPELCEELCAMSPLQAVAKAGQIAQGLNGGVAVITPVKPRAIVKPASTAPAPIKPVKGGPTTSAVPLDELPYSEYRKQRDAQEKSRYRR